MHKILRFQNLEFFRPTGKKMQLNQIFYSNYNKLKKSLLSNYLKYYSKNMLYVYLFSYYLFVLFLFVGVILVVFIWFVMFTLSISNKF